MKKMRFILFVLTMVFISLTAANPQTKFEGKLVIEQKDNGVTSTVNYYVKGQRVRLDMNSESGEGSVIFDKAIKKMLMIMPSMKMYMELPFDSTWNYSSDEDSVTDFIKTGKTKMINGYECEEWTVKEEGKTSEAWMTKQLGSIFFFGSSMGSKPKSKWEQEILGSGYFPMFAVQKDSNGNQTNSFRVKSIEKKNLEDSFFTVPADYKAMKMPASGQK